MACSRTRVHRLFGRRLWLFQATYMHKCDMAIHAEFFTMDNLIPSSVDAVDVKAAHDKITDIANSVFWAVFKFKKGIIKTSSTGTDFTSFAAQFADDEVAFASLRLKGENVFVLWIGEKSQQTDKLMATAVAPFIQAIVKACVLYKNSNSEKPSQLVSYKGDFTKSVEVPELNLIPATSFPKPLKDDICVRVYNQQKADIDQDHMIKLLKEAKGTT